MVYKKSVNGILVRLFNNEKISGLLLLTVTGISLLLANVNFIHGYRDFWQTEIGMMNISHWINDFLMAIFFLFIGLELEREVYTGELSSLKSALFPVSAAIGGMLLPACIYGILNVGTQTISGYGIPMATDIAFAIGILSLLGKKVPLSLKVFLSTLAIADDLGAIVLIALFYSKKILFINLLVTLLIFLFLIILNRRKVYKLWIYILGGLLMWYFLYKSGVHATISGVLLAFAIPFQKGEPNSCSTRLEHFLKKPVALIIMPLFAMANTSFSIQFDSGDFFNKSFVMGIIMGLFLGKPFGILLFSFLSSKLRIASKPENIRWDHIFGVGILAGIGFTISIFITLLAFNDPIVINMSKLAILMASVLAGISGYLLLRWRL